MAENTFETKTSTVISLALGVLKYTAKREKSYSAESQGTITSPTGTRWVAATHLLST